jgi:hypothetical protein
MFRRHGYLSKKDDFPRTSARNIRRTDIAEEVAMEITGLAVSSLCQSVSAPGQTLATLT